MVQIPSDGSERTGTWFFAQSSLGSTHFAFRITFSFLGMQRRRAKSPHRVAAASWTNPLDFLQLADGGGGPDPVPSWAIAPSGDPDPAPDHLVTGGLIAPADLPCSELRPCADKFSKVLSSDVHRTTLPHPLSYPNQPIPHVARTPAHLAPPPGNGGE